MAETKPLPKPGDACPACGDELRDVRAATAEERARATDKENPVNLGPSVDLAAPSVIDELGPLARCRGCGYQTRYPPETAAEVRASTKHAKGARATAAAGSSKD